MIDERRYPKRYVVLCHARQHCPYPQPIVTRGLYMGPSDGSGWADGHLDLGKRSIGNNANLTWHWQRELGDPPPGRESAGRRGRWEPPRKTPMARDMHNSENSAMQRTVMVAAGATAWTTSTSARTVGRCKGHRGVRERFEETTLEKRREANNTNLVQLDD